MKNAPFYVPPADSVEMKYLHERRQALGGYLPSRPTEHPKTEIPRLDAIKNTIANKMTSRADKETGELSKLSTTMAFVRLLGDLLRDKTIGKSIVPIVPDESRTFGMEGLFKQVGIYAHAGQLYEPIRRDNEKLLYYKEAENGQFSTKGSPKQARWHPLMPPERPIRNMESI